MKYIANAVEVDARIIVGTGAVLTDGSMHLALQDGLNITADNGMIARYIPKEGDYLVVQSDGYAYVNPKEVFERKYSPAPAPSAPEPIPVPMGFTLALSHLKEGQKIARRGWNGKGMWLDLQVPDANSKMTLPYIYMRTAQGDLVPWLASQTDILATDWHVVHEPSA